MKTILSDWLAKNDTSMAELARQIKASRSAVHRIVTGNRKPSFTMAQKLSEVTGIPASKLRPDIAKVFQGGR